MYFMGDYASDTPLQSELRGLRKNSRCFVPWLSSSFGIVHAIEMIVAFLSKAAWIACELKVGRSAQLADGLLRDSVMEIDA